MAGMSRLLVALRPLSGQIGDYVVIRLPLGQQPAECFMRYAGGVEVTGLRGCGDGLR